MLFGSFKSKFLAGIALAVTIIGGAEAAQCVLFSGPDRHGDRVHLTPNCEHPQLCALYISRRSWHGHLYGWKGRDVTWDRNIQSVDVPIGYALELYVNEGFDPRGGGVILNSIGTRSLQHYNRLIRSVRCIHTGDPNPAAIDMNGNGFRVQ